MSFTIHFTQTKSADNVVDKEFALGGIDLVGALREGSSIIDPVILVEANAPGFHANGYNYCHIEEFGRYYFITNIVSPNYTLWEIHCHVDVLMSFKDQIKAQTAIVARQERQYNLMLDDGSFMSYQNPKIQTKLFSVEGPFETQEFVLIVAGNSANFTSVVEEPDPQEDKEPDKT